MNNGTDTRPYTKGFVTSQDGTTIGYRQMGEGPGVILVHGGMQASQNFMRLASALADSFTVYVPDRRGRGLSGPFGDNYTVAKAVEDMKALLDKSAAHSLFGLSSGAILVLQSALVLPQIRKLALYEPPLSSQGSTPTDWLARFDREITQGKVVAAMITALKGTQDTSFITGLPRAISVPLMSIAIKAQAKESKAQAKKMTSGALKGARIKEDQIKEDQVALEELIPTMHYDIEMVKETENSLASYAAVSADVLLLGGSKSQGYLKIALDRLAEILPHVRRVEFMGLDHVAADNDGQPQQVADELRRFFGEPV